MNHVTPLDLQQEFFGYFDSFTGGVARGWAYNQSRPLQQLTLHVIIDGQEVGLVACDQWRDDIKLNMSHPTGRVGFEYEVPFEYFNGKPHTISFRFPNRSIVGVFSVEQPHDPSDFLEFTGEFQSKVQGFVDGLKNGQIKGWALRTPPRAQQPKGQCTILVTCNGERVAQARADRWRWDVASFMKSDPDCGFQITIPERFRKSTPQSFRILVMPDNVELDNSPCVTSVVDDQFESTLRGISDAITRMQKELTSLRKQVNGMIPSPGFSVDDYDRWARAYYDDLRKRVAEGRWRAPRKQPARDAPLVSVLIPTYRPLLSDFEAAVESVLNQTYQNWELVIVDDASRQPKLTACIDAFCKRDARIRSVPRIKNGNISEATNTALKAAKGEWVAFFDHDDLLVDVALEVMVGQALTAQADVLYSDEDKVDQAGYFLEPNLKPDWNHRYILGCNYVCHLLFVRASLLKKVGSLRSKYNGAQDHDLILRLSEQVSGEKIHHVPEILYHWRKTPNSTAVDISNKGYAGEAGVAAVADHLKRLGKKASVGTINGLTIYNVDWLYEARPRVCLIIPFKDEVAMTLRCLERLLSVTDWPEMEVILVNNWSMTAEAEGFVREANAIPGVQVLTVEEDFNYSRLNNLAAARTGAELLVFMNNDVLVTQPDWLARMVAETQADEAVAAVGAKLLYPSGLVQHAGVVVSPKDVGTHVHRGLPKDDYGYTGRARLSQEMTAVTGACMLVRADVFQAVGSFDEKGLQVAYNDVDLCLKIRAAGHKVIYCASSVAEHHESFSRGSDDRPEHEDRLARERQVMLDRWGEAFIFRHDPAYNRHFVAAGQGFNDLVALSQITASPADGIGCNDGV